MKVAYDLAIPRGDFLNFNLSKIESMSSTRFCPSNSRSEDMLLATYQSTGSHTRHILFRMEQSLSQVVIEYASMIVFPCKDPFKQTLSCRAVFIDAYKSDNQGRRKRERCPNQDMFLVTVDMMTGKVHFCIVIA